MVDGQPESEFHDYQRDLDSVGEFIRLYCSREERWASPKYLAGESYGTTRAVGLAGHLQEKFGMYLNGLILISLALDFSHLRFDVGNDVPYALYLPTYAATAWYHGKLEPPLQKKTLRKLLDEVEGYASTDYLTALFKGRALGRSGTEALNTQLARYTGLSTDYLQATRQRVEIMRFCKELKRTDGETVGRLDTRFTGFDRDSAGENMEGDPAMYAILGAYSTCMNDYARRELKVAVDVPYKAISGLYNTWSYKAFAGRYLHVADVLRKAMAMNPHLKVLVCNGYYDLATPHFASDYTFNHLGGPGALDLRIERRYYEAGHMMYVHQPSLKAVADDMLKFVQS
jgi:carboxypeptidase C (cathepsin A)